MKQTYILLLFLLWDNVEFTLTNQVCSQLPTFDNAFVSGEYIKAQYLKGDVIYFSCNPGYTTGFNVSCICTETGWKATTYGQCYEEGTFPLLLGCLPPPALKNGQLLYFNYFYADGDQVTFQCDPHYKMTGKPFKTCSNGQWTGDPQCEGSEDPRGCGSPPPLENGEFSASTTEFEHNAWVLYQCQFAHTMQGGPYKTCLNGEWTGEIACLKPCIVPIGQMNPHKLVFKWSGVDKLYVRHGDFFSFRCVPGATHDGAVEMRQMCSNGEITLPRCV